MPGGCDSHEREMPAGRTTHNPDSVRVKALCGSLVADYPDCALQILPCGCVLRQPFRAWGAVLHGDHGHPFLIEVAPCRSNLEAVRRIASIGTSRIDYLDCRCLEHFRNMPFYIWRALVLPEVRDLSLRPDVLFAVGTSGFVAREPALDGDLILKLAEESHLPEELDSALQAEGTMPLVRVKV